MSRENVLKWCDWRVCCPQFHTDRQLAACWHQSIRNVWIFSMRWGRWKPLILWDRTTPVRRTQSLRVQRNDKRDVASWVACRDLVTRGVRSLSTSRSNSTTALYFHCRRQLVCHLWRRRRERKAINSGDAADTATAVAASSLASTDIWFLVTCYSWAASCCVKPKFAHKLDLKGLLQLRFDCYSASIRLRRKMNVFIFCRVERRCSQSDGRGGQFIQTQKKLTE